MKLTISDKSKKDIFISLFQLLKNSTSIICVIFKEDQMYIQGMDNCHILLYEIILKSTWFDSYTKSPTEHSNICFDSTIFHNVINISQDSDIIVIYYEGDNEAESLHIDLETTKKGDFNKYFKIPLCDVETEMLSIPDSEYDADFSISAKKITEITNQFMKFGSDSLDFNCTEEKIIIKSFGGNCEMLVDVPIVDLSEYSISEDSEVNLSFSLNTIHKSCLSTKLTAEIVFSLHKDMPMRMKYHLDNENDNHITFYLAPKTKDE